MTQSISPQELRRHWITHNEIALLDVREEGPYSISHPLWALSLPVSEIEVKLPSLVPRLSAPIVVYDAGEGYVERAVARIKALGYQDVAILEGGLSAYAKVGEVYRDVNVPSKAFGELVEAIRQTPSISAEDADKLLASNDNVVVLDARRYEEYHTMSIPHGRSCPGGELLYRIFEAAPSPDTTVIVNCAGRTRGLVGTQSLMNSGVPNKVMALRNGTIGWTLGGLQLDQNKAVRVPLPSQEAGVKARHHAEAWAKHVGVPIIDADELSQLVRNRASRSLYLLDVRDPEEYASGHVKGFTLAPGGQLVQATDEWVGVRGGQIVLYDTDGVRARITATWLLQLGWEVYVLSDLSSVPDILPHLEAPSWRAPELPSVTVDEITSMDNVTVVDLARSPAYKKGHIQGSWFASGPELVRDLNSLQDAKENMVVLTSPDGNIAAANVQHARDMIGRQISYLVGGTQAWVAAGRPLETESRWLSQPIDVYKRPYEGTSNAREDMQAYIDWEHQLVAQLANDGVACFHVRRGMGDGGD
ncbi:Rhodanese-like domain-containing protein [Emericellopsis atlantica]|uniref:Rhodanese-like domain-containing protein n=1 Tax=Emericellopsis atlantica TaxID=2614577 RepID=A0A9P8CR29_9HYPO|nr:Rhodanese-like domain-containing protein [Emericellopsis atlantica]KAG9256589.1 Rhodanese-like domain-containing protein [Emericellopsis atlantica]